MAGENSIGEFEFLALLGEVEAVRQVIELDERPGTNGTTVTWTGRKGKPFQLISQVDAVDYAHARTLYNLYLTLTDSNPVPIVQGGVPSEIVQVLDVQPLRIGALAGSAGQRIHPPSKGWCECLWTLVAVLT
jgi:hypothetical protein